MTPLAVMLALEFQGPVTCVGDGLCLGRSADTSSWTCTADRCTTATPDWSAMACRVNGKWQVNRTEVYGPGSETILAAARELGEEPEWAVEDRGASVTLTSPAMVIDVVVSCEGEDCLGAVLTTATVLCDTKLPWE